MKLSRIILTGSATALLTACATQAPYPPNSFNPTTEVVTKTVTVPAALPAVQASYGYGNNPAIVKAYEMYRQTGKASNVYTSGFVSFPYSITEQPIIDCAPMFVCTIEFQQGELIRDIALGDTANWETKTMLMGGKWPDGAEILVVKPKITDTSTNMVVTTDKRVYNLSLLSSDNTEYARLVTFYYPSDTDASIVASAQAALQQEASQAQSVAYSSPNIDLSQVNFNYSITGDSPSWKPVRVFDDGTHTFIQFPAILASTTLPVLYVYENGNQELVNWRKSDSYYVVDRLFKKAVLLSGVGNNQTLVTITNNAMN